MRKLIDRLPNLLGHRICREWTILHRRSVIGYESLGSSTRRRPCLAVMRAISRACRGRDFGPYVSPTADGFLYGFNDLISRFFGATG